MALADAVSSAVANWPLSEASGDAADSLAGNDLTDNATVGSAAGLFGNCRDFELTNSEYFSRADNADLSTGDITFCFALWVTIESDVDMAILSKWSFGGDKEYNLGYVAFDNWFMWQVHDGSAASSCHSGAVSTGTRYLVVVYHNAATNEIGISVDAGAYATASHTTGAANSTAPFMLGHEEGGSALYFDGTLEDVTFLKNYVLSDAEVDELKNGGAGKPFADWSGGGPPAVNRRRRVILCGSR